MHGSPQTRQEYVYAGPLWTANRFTSEEVKELARRASLSEQELLKHLRKIEDILDCVPRAGKLPVFTPSFLSPKRPQYVLDLKELDNASINELKKVFKSIGLVVWKDESSLSVNGPKDMAMVELLGLSRGSDYFLRPRTQGSNYRGYVDEVIAYADARLAALAATAVRVQKEVNASAPKRTKIMHGTARVQPLKPELKRYFREQAAAQHGVPVENLSEELNRGAYANEYEWRGGKLFRKAAGQWQRVSPEEIERLTNERSTELLKIHKDFVQSRVRIAMKSKRFNTSGIIGPNDLMQEGMLALSQALQMFATGAGNSFLAYASKCVDGALIRYLDEHHSSVARKPARIQAQVNKHYDKEKAAQHIAVPQNGHEKSIHDDRSERNLLTPDAAVIVPLHTLDAEARADVTLLSGDASFANGVLNELTKDRLRRVVSTIMTKVLTPRQERIVRLRYGIGTDSSEGMTLHKIAEQVKGFDGEMISSGRIGMIERQALMRLRFALRNTFGSINKSGIRLLSFEELQQMLQY